VTIDEFVRRFDDDPGYLDFARVGPIGRAAVEEQLAQTSALGTARFGFLAGMMAQDARVRQAVSALIGFPADRIAFQPNTSQGLMQVMFGLTGPVLLSLGEFPSVTFAAERARETGVEVEPRWLDTDHGRVTPGTVRSQLTDDVAAVAVSLVDFRTGFVTDLEGIRQVIGDRLLIVDAIQGFTVVDAPYQVADVVVSGGQKWARAGWSTGFLALSDRAVSRIRPALSGFPGTDAEGTPVDEVPPPTHGAGAFVISNPDCVAEARLAASLEEIAQVGVPAIAAEVANRVSRIVDLADEFAVPVASSRDERERAGIVVLEPEPEALTLLTASLHNHGVTATVREGAVRLSPHVTTGEETFAMLRAALTSFASAINP
jgi:selenocysteine lyase/cysteine desulfurase